MSEGRTRLMPMALVHSVRTTIRTKGMLLYAIVIQQNSTKSRQTGNHHAFKAHVPSQPNEEALTRNTALQQLRLPLRAIVPQEYYTSS